MWFLRSNRRCGECSSNGTLTDRGMETKPSFHSCMMNTCDRRNLKLASLPSHVVAALGIGACFYQPKIPKSVWLIGAACSVIPDLDVIGFHFGIRYEGFWGHRGFAHSLVFAALLALIIVALGFRHGVTGMHAFTVWLYFFLATGSHGLLDAMTDGGLGVAFFSPFNNRRYFLPWTPIRVSPIGVGRFFGARSFAVLKSEFLWIWVPAIVLAVSVILLRQGRTGAKAELISR